MLLNGTSSSGKSAVAGELLDVFDEPWFHLPVDAFHAMRARKVMPQPQLDALFKRTRLGYHRAVDELNRREGARGDRELGMAEAQFPVVHVGVDYDCEVDTSLHTARECALEISRFMDTITGPGAFDRLLAGQRPC